MTVQTLASGRPPSARYPSLGGTSGVSLVSPPERNMTLFAGYPNCGKSIFCASNPDAFIINLDKSSFKDPPKATIWPFMTPEGVFTTDGTTPFILTYDHIVTLIDKLKGLASGNQPRPRTIIFDSLGSLIPLMQQWAAKQFGKTAWKEIDGRAGWGLIYDTIASQMNDLHNHGYGVIYTAHLVDSTKKIAEDVVQVVTEINLSEALYNHRLLSLFEFVAIIEKQPVMVKAPDPRYPNDPRRQIDVPSHRVILTDVTANLSLNRELKCRVDLKGPITLPRNDGWQVFREAYLSAASTGV